MEALAARHERSTLRVVFVSSDYPIPGGPAIGGIGAHTYALSHAVAALGHDVHVITESASDAREFLDGPVTVDARPKGSGRAWKLGHVIPLGWLRRTAAVLGALRQANLRRPIDFISFPDGYGEGLLHSFAPVAPFAIQLFGPASIVQRWDGRAVPAMRAGFESWMERRPTRRAALVVSATRQFAEHMTRAWSLDPRRIRIIRNPLDLVRFRPGPQRPPSERPRVLFVGHLQHLKGVGVLADAIPRLLRDHPTTEVTLVGNDTATAPDGGSMRRHLERILQTSGSLTNVRFEPPIPQAKLIPLYQDCTVFVLPSLNDVYPNAVLEAMACGRPCVVTKTVGAAELVAEADAGRVIPPDDAPALAAAIGEILFLGRDERQAMGARGRVIVERSCATSLIAAQTVAAYREVLADRAEHLPEPAGRQP